MRFLLNSSWMMPLPVAAALMFGASANAGILDTNVEKTPVTVAPLTIIVPADAGIQHTAQGLVRDIGVQERWVPVYKNGVAMSYVVRNEQTRPTDFVVHARVSNGTAGSGVKYTVAYEIKDNADGGYSATFTPRDRGSYQQGLIGKYPVPDFGDNELHDYLLDFGLLYKFEVESPYPTEAVNGNFVRMAKASPPRPGEAEAIGGRIFQNRFAIPFGNKSLRFAIEIYPYHSGSKVVAYARVPALETAPGVADYAVLLADAKRQLERIAKD
jgi:hypothetical protein